MKRTIQAEELFMFILGVYLFRQTGYSWWWFFGLFLVPDIGMTGYLWGSRTGAVTYNLLHHKGIAIGLFLLGVFLRSQPLQMAGAICFAHSGFDRMLGYGLKYGNSFNNTHLDRKGEKFK
ncbi:DUF4260 family protein [Sinomicrobium pectinilyticum]|uniref:DUF4260 family protein n=1 Tax=Sinomicrobium pectinilyticum TaxID=1084421 RepID=A0A3N0DNZ3_SINP1|nr:DUF4260 domain-containing protein [Sinomicrobium pectinilyticum]RNL77375.1 DUF4260 family protein [Sinomicrobium pectinilyticum]